MQGNYQYAERWYKLVLAFNPNFAIAHMNLTSIYMETGRTAEAETCREQAYRSQRIFIEEEGVPLRRVLILYAGKASGNIPFELLLPTATCCRIKYVIDYAAESEDESLPYYDLVFNAIGEPDIAVSLADRLQRFVRRNPGPLLNPPDVVALTQRHHLSTLLGDIENLVVMPCLRIESLPVSKAELVEDLADGGFALPLLIRPTGAHGGDRLELCATMEEVASKAITLNSSCYLTQYFDYKSADGYYRKYRIIYVDREPFAYHLAISASWKVHYESAGMEQNAWRIEEEHRFLQDPITALGASAMKAIDEIGKRLDLDYAGIDFALLPNGKVLVFEANPAMLVHRETSNGVLAHKNQFVQGIVDAFERLLTRKMS
jgi:tetratricopeptide (TPR) repeat protein